jgi:glycosidase
MKGFPHMKKEQLLLQLFDSLYPNQTKAKQNLIDLLHAHKKPEQESIWFREIPIMAETIYVDRFSNTLLGLIDKIDYFKHLGINLLHLMPILKTRKEENDGGYAVVDFNEIEEKFGTLDDLKYVIKHLHENGIHVMIDYVLNHVAKEHMWALKALDNDRFYQDFFMMFDSDTIPKQFDLTVPLVIPERKPTNFTYISSIKKYIYTSFSDYQWDLNYKNPYVFIEMIEQMIVFDSWGLDMIRLDAIPFMWKTLGTTCRNLPEVHILMRMFRLTRDITCPNLALLGEAIVEPHEIVKYFGTDDAKECDVMYNANLMVDIWHTIATKDARLLTVDAKRFDLPKHAMWLNYARCHDDIGWGFNEDAIRSFDQDPFNHKSFLISFFNGTFPTSFSKGIDYQKNETTKDARTNGMLASLSGLEQAMDYHAKTLIELSMKRILIIHALLLSYQGAPMIYAGDEIAMLNDYSYKDNELTKYDSRWIHRPYYDWNLYDNVRHLLDLRHHIYDEIKLLTEIRHQEHLLKPIIKQTVVEHHEDNGLFIIKKEFNDDVLYALFNFSDHNIYMSIDLLCPDKNTCSFKDIIHGRLIDHTQKIVTLTPYEYMYIK